MDKKTKKYLFVTGGVCSSLGKGIAASSIGALLTASGYRVNMMKIDPYLNVDAGTMRPYEHGEVYVTDDGTETDLDLGNYERFVRVKTSALNSVTTGQIYQKVIDSERKGEYLGQTVQVIPHITDEIKRRIVIADEGKESDFIIIELGGTIGDIEGIPFVEAIRQFSLEYGRNNVKLAHLTLIPKLKGSGELKTKPTQHSVKSLMSMGIQPDFLFCRTETEIPQTLLEKVALFCNIEPNSIFSAINVKHSIYEVPLIYHRQGADRVIQEKFGLEYREPDLRKWEDIVKIDAHPEKEVKIAFVGKYISLDDAYKSVDEALKHGGFANNARVVIQRVDSENLEKDMAALPADIDGILVPGGFGNRGIEGKIAAARFARTKKMPYFGICLGMQCLVIEYARSFCQMKGANSTEFDTETHFPIIELLSNLKSIKYLGGTMRRGSSLTKIEAGTQLRTIYGKDEIYERHRHRYEVNPEYVAAIAEKGLTISGTAESGLVEMVELKDHPWYIGVQFHPEFKSSPIEPHPLFASFIRAALEHRKARTGEA